MKPGGWILLIVSTACVWSLTAWCYWKVLSAPPEDHVVKPPDSLGG